MITKSTVGVLLFLAGVVVLMGIITGEIFYPISYSTALNEISDLGATAPPNSVIYPAPSNIFNGTMMVSGIMITLAFLGLIKVQNHKFSLIPIGILGIGMIGVGFFPGNKAPLHGIFALTTFIAGALAAILSFRITYSPFKYVSMAMGLVSLTFLFLAFFFAQVIFPVLGDGGTERWIAYPIILWIVGFGTYLMGEGGSVRT